jgi:chromosome segregation ATPase
MRAHNLNRTLASRTHELEEENALLRQHRSSSSNEAANLERLLVSIDRIRGERDEVKRQLEFLEMEHKFTQQQLDQERSRAQLDQSRSVDALHSTTSRNIHHLRTIRRLERRADAFVAIFNHAQTQRDSSESTAQTLIEQLDHLREKHIHDVQGLQAEAQQFREDLGHAHEELDDTREALAQAQQDLDESMCSLEEVTTQRRELNLRLYDAQGDLTDGHSFIKELELQLEATQQELAGVVSERDSLRVHAGNLDQEVGAIKAELAEAEQRYSMLQAQQLATMSAEALPKRLKAQLQELEERLARRTKEKENLVHDVKRLETNMRLQEERLGEITAELETAQMENKAMVEDCETTRESRDDALRRVDDLEVDIDALEVQVADSDSKLRYAEASWQTRVTGLLLALADAATKSRTMSRAWKGALDRRDQGLDGLSTRLQQAEEENVRLWGTSRTAETRRAEAAGAAQQMAYELQALQKEVLEGSEDLRNTVLALTLSHQHQRHQQSLVYDFQNARTTMRSRIDTLQRSLDDHRARLVVATEQLKDAQRLRGDSDALRARHAELQTTVARLEQELSEMEAVVNHKVDELAARTATHNALSDQVAELTDDKARLASNLEAAVQSHAEEAKELQDRLSAASMEIDSLRQSDDLERQLADLRSEHDTALRSLQADLDRALERATETDTCLRQATDAREQIEQELARIRQEHEQHIEDMTTDTHAMLALRAELSDLRTHHEARIAEAKEAADVASAGMGELEASLHEAERVRAELQERYAQSEQSLQASLSELEVSNAALRAENDTKEMQLGQAAMSDRQWSEKLQESQDTVMRLSSEANQLQSTQESLNITIAEK